MPETGRNDPCPCGSGLKYKKCCMFKDQPNVGPQEMARSKLVADLLAFTDRKYKSILPEAYDVFWNGEHPEKSLSKDYDDFTDINFNEWLMIDFPAIATSGETIVELFLKSGKNLSETEKVVLNLFRESVISLFEVQEVMPEKGLVLKDLLLGGEYQVWEKSATRSLVKWDIFASRLMMIDGQYILNASVYPYLVKRKQELLTAIKGEYDFYCAHVGERSWKEFLKANATIFNRLWYDRGADYRPGIRTTTGEPLIFSKAVFEIRDRDQALEKLRTVKKLSFDSKNQITWLDNPEEEGSTVLGTIQIKGKTLILECMSKKRLEQGKKMIREALVGLAVYKTDTFKDPYEVMAKPKPAKIKSGIPPEIERQVLDKFMREHMEKWIDEKIPALDNQTPRECVATEAGRKRVTELLKSFENLEEHKRKNGEHFYDLSWVWSKLGLTRPE